MDKLKEDKKIKDEKNEEGAFSRIKNKFSAIRSGEIQTDRRRLVGDLLLFAVGFVLSRCHIAFSSRPIGLAFVAMLPTGVWSALVGAVLGSLTLGIDGVIFAAAATVTVLIRAAISCGDRDKDGRVLLFSENLLTRMSVSVLGGFITAVYEVLLLGLNEASLLFGLVMILLTPIFTFALSGIFSSGITADELLHGGDDTLSLGGVERGVKYDRIFFHLSALLLLFCISLSFKDVSFAGISVSYILAGLMTLAVAKRFGAIRAAAVGFVCSVAISAELSVAFALAGIGSGLVFGLGNLYAIIVGGVAVCLWSGYAEGLSGLLSILPEYLIASAIAMPIIKKITVTGVEKTTDRTDDVSESSEDMVGTMALSYQARREGNLTALSEVLSNLSTVISSHTDPSVRLSREEYRQVVISVAEKNCIGCLGGSLCAKEDIRPSIKNADRLAEVLMNGEKILPSDVNTDTEFCQKAEIIADEINRSARDAERQLLLRSELMEKGEEYRLISSLIRQIAEDDMNEVRVNNGMTLPLTAAFESCGFKNGTIRAFGQRRKHFILAGEDENGARISSFELRKSIEGAAGVRLGTPEYFRRGRLVLMECGIKKRLKAECATVGRAGKSNEISGDYAICFSSREDYFYSLICDGMGSGELARETSLIACEYIRAAADAGQIKDTVIHLLNRDLRTRKEECSTTVDLFEVDLLSGQASFLKNGAAPSYIKRESSLFRIRSQSTPIGLLRSAEPEKIPLEIKAGDYIIMMSDGIADATEDAPWLLLLLGEEPKGSLNDYATLILNEAIKNTDSADDMTVTVIKIEEA